VIIVIECASATVVSCVLRRRSSVSTHPLSQDYQLEDVHQALRGSTRMHSRLAQVSEDMVETFHKVVNDDHAKEMLAEQRQHFLHEVASVSENLDRVESQAQNLTQTNLMQRALLEKLRRERDLWKVRVPLPAILSLFVLQGGVFDRYPLTFLARRGL
jgi:septal ring factor EnvC (AmiA/AmiB activator)